MKILYLGSMRNGATSAHRAAALRRLGHTVIAADPYVLPQLGLRRRGLGNFHYRTGYRFIQRFLTRWIESGALDAGQGDAVWIDSGELFGPGPMKALKQRFGHAILYNHDDVTGPRDGARFASLKTALREFDLCVVVREQNVPEYRALGAKQVIKVWRSYDEIEHRPFMAESDIAPEFRSDVSFVGTWIRGDERDAFLARLIQCHVPLTIWGDRWHKSPAWKLLRPHWRGPSLSGRDYVAALQGAKVCLGLLSRGNRDRHTTRTVEIPYAGALLCAERTDEHLMLYREDREAVFWSDAEECADKCKALLADEHRRLEVRAAGASKVRSLGVGHEDICRVVLAAL
jgi:spore maturation protein CgeB